MTKKDIIAALAARTEFTKKDTELFLNEFVSFVTESVAAGEKVALSGFGAWETTTRGERMGRNPQTGEPMKISSRTSPRFKAGKLFKDAVAASKTKSKKR